MDLREVRDAGFAEERRRHVELLAARDPECWSWPSSLDWNDVADFCGGPIEGLLERFEAEEAHALYIALAAWHRDRCAVCGYRDPRLVRDHDHETGMIRGLLCRSCNGLEPHDDGLFEKYRSQPPAQILGIRLRYYSRAHGWVEPRILLRRQLDNHPAYALASRLAARLQPDATE
ncbi:endonuclease domain-containing protein [Streptomyces griseoluteus]